MNKNSLLLIVLVMLMGGRQATAQLANGSFRMGVIATPKVNRIDFEAPDLGENRTKLGYNLEFSLFYQQSNRIGVGIGAKLSVDQFDIKDYSPRLGCDFDVITGTADAYSSWFADELTSTYLGIPISFRYHWPTSKRAFFAKLGYEYLFHLSSDVNTVLWSCGTGTLLTNNTLREVNPNGSKLSLGFGLMPKLNANGKLRLVIEPELAYWLTSIYEEDRLSDSIINNIRPWDAGLRIGILF